MYSSSTTQRFVIKRNGIKQRFYFDKITARLENLLTNEEKNMIDCSLITEKVIKTIYSGITSEELDIESAKICHNLSSVHPLYDKLAGMILVSNHHKKNKMTFIEKTQYIWDMHPEKPMLDEKYYNYVVENCDEWEKIINYKRDFLFQYFGFKTLENAYLIKDTNGKVVESPQDMYLRVAIALNIGDMEMIRTTYEALSMHTYTHASPTLFNSGMRKQQLASCFLLGVGDSIQGFTKSFADFSSISAEGGGIGANISNVRAKGSLIKSTNGKANGIIPLLKVYNELSRLVNQSGKRKGSFAFYIEPHHPDLLDFLELKKNYGSETERARDLFLALWISDLFMKQVESDGDWYFMCPDKCTGLSSTFGEDYEKLYWQYVKEEKYNKKVKAQDVMKAILDAQIETGVPYIAFKDNINRKTNQANLGTIQNSNLCIEIMQYSDTNEYATCNLASIPINKFTIPFKQEKTFTIYTKKDCKYCKWSKNFMEYNKFDYNIIDDEDGSMIRNNYIMADMFNDRKITFPQILYGSEYVGGFDELYRFVAHKYDYKKLEDCAYLVVRNLNNVIDINYYPTIETKKSNMRHRPIGMGIQGVADALTMMKIPFDSNEAVEFNKRFMEAIYKGGISASVDIASERYEMVKYMIDNIEDKTIVPEYYDSSYCFEDTKMDRYYHSLKLNRCELENKIAFGSYSSFEGSPASAGKLQFDMWDTVPSDLEFWNDIKIKIKKYGMRNSLITALMPTASSSNILGNCECFEPYTNNIFTRKILAGDFVITNKHMINDMIAIGEWNNNVKDFIIADNGSLQRLNISQAVKDQYKTMWEIKQVWVLKNALARSPYVDQGQSMNIYMATPNFKKLYSSHFWAWKNGLKTGMYYLKSRAARDATKFSVDYNIMKKLEDEECISCSA